MASEGERWRKHEGKGWGEIEGHRGDFARADDPITLSEIVTKPSVSLCGGGIEV
jgi:hypothetical protein